MDDRISPAIDALQQRLHQQILDVTETKKAINMLCKATGQEPMYRDVEPESIAGSQRRDRYYGKPLATVAQQFLEARGEACTPEEIFQGLKAGAFDFKAQEWGGNDKDWIRNLSISLAKNTKAFHRLPNGTFGLLTWYPDVVTDKKREAKTDAKTKAGSATSGGGETSNGVEEEK